MIVDADDERCGSGRRRHREYADADEGRGGKQR